MTRILAIHGVRNYKNGDPPISESLRIGATWHAALTPRLPTLRAADLRAAYYADLLRSDTQGTNQADSDDAEQMLTAELLNQWAAAWQADLSGVQGPITAPLRHIAGHIAARSAGRTDARLVENTARLFFPEVARYLGYARDGRSRRHSVRRRVAEALTSCRPQIVIAHSLGSVVAYEVLHAYPHIQIDLLITLGSPLALPGAIFERLDPAPLAGLGSKPASVKRWVNLADTGDFIAVPKGTLVQRFAGLDEHHEITIGPIASHDVTKYLAHQKVIETLR